MTSPKKKTQQNYKPVEWAFTTREGGFFYQLPLPTDDEFISAMETLVQQVQSNKRYLKHPEGAYNRNYTVIPIPHGRKIETINIYSLRFPDGRIWDAGLRAFRQHEQQKN